MSNGTHPEAPRAGDGLTAADENTSGTLATAARPTRFDYRLRGLDLGAEDVSEAPRLSLSTHQPNRRRRRRALIKWAVFAAVTVLVALLLRASVLEPYSVTTPSMVPTLQPGYRILVMKSGVLPQPLKAGDIIVFHHSPQVTCGVGGARDLVKRIIGLPGQTIWSAGDTIYVNGRILNERGWTNPPYGQLGPTAIGRTTIPSGEYFVMGDNRTDTCDSRSFGPIRSSSVVGKVVATILRNGHVYVQLF